MIRRSWMGARVLALLGILLAPVTGATLPEGDAARHGMDGAALQALRATLDARPGDVHGLLLARHGHRVFEWYASGGHREQVRNAYSVTKSVLGTLVGMAIDSGHLAGVRASVGDVLGDRRRPLSGQRVAAVRLDQLLRMRGGWPDSRAPGGGGDGALFVRLHQAPDRLGLLLAEPLAGEPGQRFRYGNADPQMLAALLHCCAGVGPLPAYLDRVLAAPLGWRGHRWPGADATGLPPGGYGLHLRPVDMLSLGELYLREGRWQGQQLLSRAWVRQATRADRGYGYLWWTRVAAAGWRSYAALGLYGQVIQVIPQLDLVMVMSADIRDGSAARLRRQLVREHVVPAVAQAHRPGLARE